MRNILIKIAYDGTGFAGWQRQSNARTVCGELERVLSILAGTDIKISGTSRTDAGVHALGQCASFTLPDDGIPTERIPRAANRLLAPDRVESIGDIKVLSAQEMPEGFHARHSCKGKRYIYRIYNCREKSPFRRTQFYQIAEKLDVDAMRKAAEYIVGEHDFVCFMTSGGEPGDSTIRTVFDLDITEAPVSDEASNITISISGSGFLYNMVRIITGTLVEVGLGKRSPESVEDIILSKDRGKAGHVAPPQGLYLEEVFYE